MDWIIGIDEVGRGCLAGHVSVGAVMVPVGMASISGVNDSKKLSPAKREQVNTAILAASDVHVAVVSAPVDMIDKNGIDRSVLACFEGATRRLLARAAENNLGPVIEIRIDGKAPRTSFMPGYPVKFIIDGDALDWVIGAASIVAKVKRDQQMVELAREYPGYDWEQNCGYGTPKHIAAIKKLGLTPLHRAKFCRNFTPASKEDPGVFGLCD